MGRPKIPAKAKKVEAVRIWLPVADKHAFEMAAAARGQSASNLGRALIMEFLDGKVLALRGARTCNADTG